MAGCNTHGSEFQDSRPTYSVDRQIFCDSPRRRFSYSIVLRIPRPVSGRCRCGRSTVEGMSEPSGSAGVGRYHRRKRSPFRVVDGRCLVAAPGHKTVAISGSAVLVWLLLDSPESATGLLTRVHEEWPELEEITAFRVQAALNTLEAQGLVFREGLAKQGVR